MKKNKKKYEMSFDIEELFEFCRNEIIEFSKAHPNEIFYGFAIDASLLCLNSEEQFRSALTEFEERWRTLPADELVEFRANTGDWAYQGFADMSSHQAWDEKLYDDHYYESMDSEEFNAKYTHMPWRWVNL